jgi:hypothetical protein
MANQAVPEKWKLFPGPLFGQFRDRFFSAPSKTKDAMEWLRREYRQDAQARIAESLIRPKIVDAFWNKDFFDAFRQGNRGFNFPLQQSDVDTQFSVFSLHPFG